MSEPTLTQIRKHILATALPEDFQSAKKPSSLVSPKVTGPSPGFSFSLCKLFEPLFSHSDPDPIYALETRVTCSLLLFSSSGYLNGLWQTQEYGNSWNSPLPDLISSGSPMNPLWYDFTFLANVSQSILFRAMNKALSFFAFGLMVLLCPMYLL